MNSLPMKINVAWESKNKKGGGFSFSETFARHKDVELVPWQEADVVLIPSASVITKELFREMKSVGKKVILRVDNALKDSRNSGVGMNRMVEFANGADCVVYQGQWAQDYLSPFLGVKGHVIHNGVDQNIFKPQGDKALEYKDGRKVYMYACASKGETKQWEWAWWRYQMIFREDPEALLMLVGNFPDDVEKYNFNFFMGEKYAYYGYVPTPENMASLYRSTHSLMAYYTNDCFSQTYLEAISCGCELFEPHMSGGTPEILSLLETKGVEYFSSDRMIEEYLQLFETI